MRNKLLLLILVLLTFKYPSLSQIIKSTDITWQDVSFRKGSNFFSPSSYILGLSGNNNEDSTMATIQFDVSTIDTLNLTSVNLVLVKYYNDNSKALIPQHPIGFYIINEAWDENTISYTNLPDINPTPFFTLDNSVEVFNKNIHHYSIPLDVNLIKSWKKDPSSNHGIAIKSVAGPIYDMLFLFQSKESQFPNQRPYLSINNPADKISGKITNNAGAAVEGAVVRARYRYTNHNYDFLATYAIDTTDAHGNYELNTRFPLEYLISVETNKYLPHFEYDSIKLGEQKTKDIILMAAINPVAGQAEGKWTKAESPYQIINEVVVPENSKLTIEPGVEVVFYGPYELLVEGQLKAQGTFSDSIKFYSHKSDSALHGAGVSILQDYYPPNEDSLIIAYARFSNFLSFDGFHGIRIKDYGGALNVRNVKHVAILHSIFEGNIAQQGGALYLAGIKDLSLSSCVFYNNKAYRNGSSDGGAGIYSGNCRGNITNCLFNKNKTTTEIWNSEGGGAIRISSGFLNIINNTIVNNTCQKGSAMYFSSISDSSVVANNIIWGNEGMRKDGSQISIDNQNKGVVFFNNIIENNSFNITNRSSIIQTVIFDDTTNINVNPNLNTDFTLPSNSPAIDVGNGIYVFDDTLDLAGNPRISGANCSKTVDLGAFERQYGDSIDYIKEDIPFAIPCQQMNVSAFKVMDNKRKLLVDTIDKAGSYVLETTNEGCISYIPFTIDSIYDAPIIQVNNNNELIISNYPLAKDVDWFLGTSFIEKTTSPIYKFSESGIYSAQLNYNSCRLISQEIAVETTIGTKKEKLIQNIHPNPTSSLLNIELLRPGIISVINESGIKVYEQYYLEGEHRVDFSSFRNGVYALLINGSPEGKVVVIK